MRLFGYLEPSTDLFQMRSARLVGFLGTDDHSSEYNQYQNTATGRISSFIFSYIYIFIYFSIQLSITKPLATGQ